MSDIRVRFAPSPTGQVHIGNIRAAIYNWLYARHTGGKFLLRVEDTDLERSTPEAVKTVLDSMEWLGLDHDGEALYAHVNFQDSLYFLQDENAVVFSTCPLGAGNWKPVPFTRLVAVQDGEFVREGGPHGHEYIYNPEDYRLIYMDFARL